MCYISGSGRCQSSGSDRAEVLVYAEDEDLQSTVLTTLQPDFYKVSPFQCKTSYSLTSKGGTMRV